MAQAKKHEDPLDYLVKRDYKRAIALYRQRLAKQPNNTDLRMGLADALLANKQEDEAIAQYRDLAAVYLQNGFVVKAIAVYKKILRLRPAMKEVEELLADLSEKRGNVQSSRPAGPETIEVPRAEPQQTPAQEVQVQDVETKLFSGMTPEEFREVVGKLKLRHFEEETMVVQEGDPGDSMFIIVRGQVRVLTKDARQNEIVLAHLGEGEFFGEVALTTGKPRTATIITNIDSELLELTRQDYETILARHPRVKEIVEEFHHQRAYKTIEAMIQSLRENR